MSSFPTEPKKIRERIKRYERGLRKEADEHGFISDGAGKRYLLGPLYMLMDDVDGALEHFAWFEKTFPGDPGESLQQICWTLALYRAGKKKEASSKFITVIAEDIHAWTLLLDEDVVYLDPDDPLEETMVNELSDGIDEIRHLWDSDALRWVREQYNSSVARNTRNKVIQEDRERREKWALRDAEQEKRETKRANLRLIK